MAKTQTKQSDSAYLLKLVLYMIVGSQWLYLTNDAMTSQIPLPIGFLIGVWFARHEQFQIDRKIEYAILLVAMLVGFWADTGVTLRLLSS